MRIPLLAITLLLPAVAWAGPPYVADDPQPTETGHYEVYLFATAKQNAAETSGAGGIDFNYGAAPDLQLTAVLPLAYQHPQGQSTSSGLGNLELAAKYRVLHQADWGWDVAVFPRLLLPSASSQIGEQRAAVLLPLWLERDWGRWSAFGGGGCTLHHGGDARNFCLLAGALARQLTPTLQLGVELQHQGADTRGGQASTSVGVGARFDAQPWLHLLGYVAPGLQHTQETARISSYVALLLTF